MKAVHPPWYKQFWPWFLLLFPIGVIVASFSTLYIFTQNSVSLVTEDYYKEGKAINLDLTKIKVAKELGLAADIRSQNTSVEIKLNKGKLKQYPALMVNFAHRTLANQDFSQTLSADAQGVYRFQSEHSIQGPWHIKIQPHDNAWLIQGKISFPSQTFIKIME